jgi:hypothetical protein
LWLPLGALQIAPNEKQNAIAFQQKSNPEENINLETQVRWPDKKAGVRWGAGGSIFLS